MKSNGMMFHNLIFNRSLQALPQRDSHIDVCRGIGIFLIVLGHNHFVHNPQGFLYSFIFSFHLPLFLFLSGLCFRDNIPILKLAVKKADRLLKPFLITLSLLLPYYWGIHNINPIDYMSYVTCGYAPSFWIPLWYLPHLFLVLLSLWIITKVGQTAFHGGWYKILCLFLLLAGSLYIIKAPVAFYINFNGQALKMPGLPLSADLLSISLFYCLAGFLAKDHFHRFRPHRLHLLLVSICFVIVFCCCYDTMDLYMRKINPFFSSILLSLLGIYISIYAAKSLDRIQSRFTRYIKLNAVSLAGEILFLLKNKGIML